MYATPVTSSERLHMTNIWHGLLSLNPNRYRLPAEIFFRGLSYPYRPGTGRVYRDRPLCRAIFNWLTSFVIIEQSSFWSIRLITAKTFSIDFLSLK